MRTDMENKILNEKIEKINALVKKMMEYKEKDYEWAYYYHLKELKSILDE